MPGRIAGLVGLVALVALLGACSGVTRLDLTAFGRAAWQRPDDVVAALAIEPGHQVADLGAGEGYFVPYLADAVGPQGRVYAVDVDPEIAAGLEEHFAARSNVSVVLGQPDDPRLPDRALDLVLLVNTYHHIGDREGYFARLSGDLSPGGRVAVIEPDADLGGVLSLLLEDGHTSRASDVVREMEAAGYRRAGSLDLLAVQIFEVFEAVDESRSHP